jgi:hypothetical protein
VVNRTAPAPIVGRALFVGGSVLGLVLGLGLGAALGLGLGAGVALGVADLTAVGVASGFGSCDDAGAALAGALAGR